MTRAVPSPRPVFMVTDFGPCGPYLGQMHIALVRTVPGLPVVDLINDMPRFSPRPAAYLLAALAAAELEPAVFLAVVDPGVGTPQRRPVVVRAGRHAFVGPDNGLFNVIARHHPEAERALIEWRPPALSDSFHGRDLFAPVAARLAAAQSVATTPLPWQDHELTDWPGDWPAVVYADGYGNLMTGLRAAGVPPSARIGAGGRELTRARTFGEVPAGSPFWYGNSSGLVELAVNGGSAAAELGLAPGDAVRVVGG
ncbi:MAG: SAM-dependent chlorinase/fluorinase [Gammaproteobacteria bacterium]|nr:SAM-dependent chlorinase/fluorinase [Gammaproteobacteria bacterium]